MDLNKFKKLLPLYLENDLQAYEMKEVADFISFNSQAKKEFEAYQKTWAFLQNLPDIQPNPNYISRFWTEAASRAKPPESIIEKIRRFVLSPRLVPVLASACVILLVASISLKKIVTTHSTDTQILQMSEADLEMVDNMEFAENVDLIEDIEFLQDLEVIENLDALQPQGEA